MEEVEKAVRRLNTSKAPGRDGVFSLTMRGIGNMDPTRIQKLLSCIFETGTFPDRWKTTRITLIRKPAKDPAKPEAYRPLCIADGGAKLVEYILQDSIDINSLADN